MVVMHTRGVLLRFNLPPCPFSAFERLPVIKLFAVRVFVLFLALFRLQRPQSPCFLLTCCIDKNLEHSTGCMTSFHGQTILRFRFLSTRLASRLTYSQSLDTQAQPGRKDSCSSTAGQG